MLHMLLLFAAEEQKQEPGNPLFSMIPVIVISLLFIYFMLILPQRQQK